MIPAVRKEAQVLMLQCRRSMSSRAGPLAKSLAAGQQRHHLSVTPTAPEAQKMPFPSSMLQRAPAPEAQKMPFPSSMLQRAPAPGAREEGSLAGARIQHRVARCRPVNAGRQVVLEFADQSRYEVHGAWLRDSSPSRRGADFYRTSAADVWKLRDFVVTDAKPMADGEQLEVTYDALGEEHKEVFETRWLHAFAPFVGKALHADAGLARTPIKGTGSLLDGLHRRQVPWRSDVEMPVFDAETLASSSDAQVEFLERMVDPGIALITGVGTPESLEREFAGKPMEDLVYKVVGKLNQHPVRSTNYGVMRKSMEAAKQGSDYDMTNPLSMHTDHSMYHGTPGYLQFLYQAEGSVRSKVCDGLALAEYMREQHPEEYKLLTTVQMTHSLRNALYSLEGAPRSITDHSTQAFPFEVVHTHPIIQLDADGVVEKVIQSETKRGVCALPYDTYEAFMKAYERWTQLCEDDRFIKHFDWPEGSCVVTNNHRTLHGRATVPPGMARTMCFGYLNKVLVENRYRILKQMQLEREGRWLTCLPNQVLEHLVR